jgi:hypothetical protein
MTDREQTVWAQSTPEMAEHVGIPPYNVGSITARSVLFHFRRTSAGRLAQVHFSDDSKACSLEHFAAFEEIDAGE